MGKEAGTVGDTVSPFYTTTFIVFTVFITNKRGRPAWGQGRGSVMLHTPGTGQACVGENLQMHTSNLILTDVVASIPHSVEAVVLA